MHIGFANYWRQDLNSDHAQNSCSEAPSGQRTTFILSALSLLHVNMCCLWMISIKKVNGYGSIVHVVIADQVTKCYLWVVSSLLLYWNIPNHHLVNAWEMLAITSEQSWSEDLATLFKIQNIHFSLNYYIISIRL